MLRHVYFDATLLPYPSVPPTRPATPTTPATASEVGAPPTSDAAAEASRPRAEAGTATLAGEKPAAPPR